MNTQMKILGKKYSIIQIHQFALDSEKYGQYTICENFDDIVFFNAVSHSFTVQTVTMESVNILERTLKKTIINDKCLSITEKRLSGTRYVIYGDDTKH